jgi:hypothetical protein
MNRFVLPLAALGLLIGGCGEKTSAPVVRPAAPRGVFRVSGDRQVTLYWLANTERDLTGYRIYWSSCANGPDCPYEPVGAMAATPRVTYEQFVVTDLSNGTRRFYAVSAVNRAGQESELSKEDVSATPRPEGSGLAIRNFVTDTTNVGYDFSLFERLDTTNPPADIFYGYYVDANEFLHQQIFVPDYSTDIQDAGYAQSLDAVSVAPDSGWSPSGTVEAIRGHVYVVWTRENTFAKFMVTAAGPSQVVVDWAYQPSVGNPELRARRVPPEGPGARRPIVWLKR